MSQAQDVQNNILIVDDTPENLTVLSRMLETHGYQVRPAVNGQVALKAISRSLPDVILLDIIMPGMNGYELCRRLKADEKTRNIPIIFISALDEVMDKVKAFAVGGVDYITKPFHAEEVLARVHTHLSVRNMQRQLQQQNVRLQKEIKVRQQMEEKITTALKEKEVLLQELHHRTESSMNVICSMLRLQSSVVWDENITQMFKDLETRVRTIALVHQRLYQTENLSRVDLKDYIYDLGILLYKNYKTNAARVELKPDLQSAYVAIDSAILCGLLLNELLSNSLKHAFPKDMTGEINLTLRTLESGEVELRVKDNGVGLPKGFDAKKDGIGLQLVRALEQSSLKGSVNYNTGDGTEWIIRFQTLKA